MLRTGIDVTADTTGNIVGDLSRAVLGSLTGVAKGLEDVILNIGDSADSLGKSVAVVSESIAEGVGDVTMTVAEGLGKIVKEIPVVGRPSAFLVKGTGQGVYYVVLSLSDIVISSLSVEASLIIITENSTFKLAIVKLISFNNFDTD